MTTLLADHLRARRVSLLALTGGLLFLSVGYLALFPSLEGQLQAFAGDIPDFYDALIGDADFTTANGYIRSQVYSLVAPLLLSGLAIAAGAALARAERSATLTPLFLSPVSRTALAGSYLATVLVVALIGGIAVIAGVVIGAPLAGAEVGLSSVVAATLPLMALAALVGSVAWAVGAVTGAPGAATGAGWGVIGVSFVLNSFGALIEDLSFLSDAQPWGWFGAGEAITESLSVSGLVALLVGTVLAGVGGILAFRRRDLQL